MPAESSLKGVQRENGGGLRQSVPLDEIEAEFPKTFGHHRVLGCPTGDEQPDRATKPLVDFVENRSLRAFPSDPCEQIGCRDQRSDEETGNLALLNGFLDALEHLVIQQRDAKEDGRVRGLKIFHNGLQRTGIMHGAATIQRAEHAAGALVAVMHRQDGKKPVLVSDENDPDHRHQVGSKIALAEHDTLRYTETPGCEDDLGEFIRINLWEILNPASRTLRKQLGHRVAAPLSRRKIHVHVPPQVLHRRLPLGKDRLELVGVEYGHRIGFVKDVKDLVHGQVPIDGAGDMIEAHTGQVAQRPLNAVLTDDGYMASLLETDHLKRCSEFQDMRQEVCIRKPWERCLPEILQGELVTEKLGGVQDHVLHGRDLGDGMGFDIAVHGVLTSDGRRAVVEGPQTPRPRRDALVWCDRYLCLVRSSTARRKRMPCWTKAGPSGQTL